MKRDFNTLYVSVQGNGEWNLSPAFDNFNTLYVSVQGTVVLTPSGDLPNFNTLYVSVQAYLLSRLFQKVSISIHYMFQFKQEHYGKRKIILKFQYIICFSSRCAKPIIYFILSEFQYIICFSSRILINFSSVCDVCRFQYIICFSSRNLRWHM